MPSREEWRQLRPALLILGLVICSVSLMLGYSGQQATQAQLALQAQQHQQLEAQHRLQAAAAEKAMLAQYLPVYQGLVQRGFIGEERRMDWIEALHTLHTQHQLFDIRYRIHPQEIYQTAPGLPSVLHRSRMQIDMPLLHEGDLLSILAALERGPHAPFLLRDCVMKRTLAGSPLAPNLNASCEIDWLTASTPLRGQP